MSYAEPGSSHMFSSTRMMVARLPLETRWRAKSLLRAPAR